MKKKFTFLGACAAFLLLGTTFSSGQNGVLLPENQVTPRRGHAPGSTVLINGASDVNNQFGAGETSTIQDGNLSWPNSNNLINLPTIRIGSTESKNIVVNTYNFGGYATQFLHIDASHASGGEWHWNIAGGADSRAANYNPANGGYGVENLTGIGASDPLPINYTIFHDSSFVTYNIEPTIIADLSAKNTSQIESLKGVLGVGTESLDNINGDGSTTSQKVNIYIANHTANYATGTRPSNYNYTADGFTINCDANDAALVGPWEANMKLKVWRLLATGTVTPYTSTKNDINAGGTDYDDKTPLVQVDGDRMESTTGTNVVHAPRENATNFKAYDRPTTVAIGGTNTYSELKINNLNWYYRTHELKPYNKSASPIQTTTGFSTNWNDYWYYGTNGIEHNAPYLINLYCGHWGNSPYTPLTWKMTSSSSEWNEDDVEATQNLLDAAVQILGGAKVCVENNVEDATGTPGDKTTGNKDNKTNAIVVVPDSDRWTLRVGKDWIKMNMAHDDSLSTATNKWVNRLYTQATFPVPASDILLDSVNKAISPSNQNFGKTMLPYTGSLIVVPAAPTTTESSLFGLYGKYDYDATNGANIHTGGTAKMSHLGTNPLTNNPGVIEVGKQTAAQRGAEKFYVYSGGILKNYEGCNGPTDNFMVEIGDPAVAPNFKIDGDSTLYIMNYGNNNVANACNAGLYFRKKAIDNLVSALGSSTEKGALHIQARGVVKFDETNAFSPNISAQNNELRILSDEANINFGNKFEYENQKDSNLVIWAQGTTPGQRSCSNDPCGGYVHFANVTSIKQATKGISLIRSEYDDILMDNTFDYTNSTNGPENGELIVQAGQDIYGQDAVTVTQAGNRPVLFEAKQSIRFNKDLTFDRTNAKNGSNFIKAGYNNFSTSAEVTDWTKPNWCTPNNYAHRIDCSTTDDGGDIWFVGQVLADKSTADDSVSTIFRAWNSIYVDNNLTYTRDQKSAGDSIAFLMFAETGNIEAIKGGATTKVAITMSGTEDTTSLRLQAGNGIPDMTDLGDTLPDCSPSLCATNTEYDGNILFNKPLEIEHKSLGHTLISASRDIENERMGKFTFNYVNPAAVLPFRMTAGRHIETHAPVIFTYEADTANIFIEAGRDCTDALCKKKEFMSNEPTATYTTYTDNLNTMSKKGDGNGSILMFDTVSFTHTSNGEIYMKALNGNIESDPYLHEVGYKGGAPLLFDHKGTGVTRMQAIDIKLHDKMEYKTDETTPATDNKNGQFYMAAYDSILTRNISYTNKLDTGSVFITTDKIKMIGDNRCEESIYQGHIVLGYGADCTTGNLNDTILFDLDNNQSTVGANILIEAGMEGFNNRTDYKGNRYGGNITFDYMLIKPAVGNHTAGGYTKIHTPNGNIWGKDSITYIGHEGDLLIDAGLGSTDDNDAIRWDASDDEYGRGTSMQANGTLGAINNDVSPNGSECPNGSENSLNTRIPNNCNDNREWRTGNIMIKGGSLTYPTNEGGYATLRTRAGYIDLYDKFDVTGMTGQLLIYAHSDAVADDTIRQYSDVSTRDFHYEPSNDGSSVYFGADDNIMLNYGNSNGSQIYTNNECPVSGNYEYDGNNLYDQTNPFYWTSYMNSIDVCRSIFNVNTNGYQWYNNASEPVVWRNGLHMLYRGGKKSCSTSGITGECETPSNGARDIVLDFTAKTTGGFATVANNYIDYFTKLTYNGGSGSGLETPSVGTIIGENVAGYGLFIKSRYQGAKPETRRRTCENCTPEEWPVVTFHDDARIHTENQKSVIESPVVEFFGHTELDSYTGNSNSGKITLKGDSLIFHDSVIFDGTYLELAPFTTDAAARAKNFRYGVMNDKNANKFYKEYGMAIKMEDRGTPVLELGYQRCNEPSDGVNKAPNLNSKAGKESIPEVGGDIIVSFKHDFILPIYNTVVANHARISFVSDSLDGPGGEYVDTYIRTDLLRIRNKVEFYNGEGTGNNDPKNRKGLLKMSSYDYMNEVKETGIYPHHLHMEPNSELSLPGEDSLIINPTTTVGGYGNIHENVFVKANGTIAPGYASLMEEDCQTPHGQGRLTVHNLTMEKDAIFRISIGRYNQCYDEDGNKKDEKNCTATDVLQVEDSIFFNGKIPLHVLLEGDKDLDAILDEGCYLFLEYNDTLGMSKEYVKNFTLPIDRYQDNYFGLDYSTPGKVYLCVMKFPQPIVQRYVKLPAVEGVTTTPNAGTHYIGGHKDFTFTAKFSGTPLKVWAKGYYHGGPIDLDQTATLLPDGSYQYTIMQVVQPYDVEIGPETSSAVGNDYVGAPLVYAYKNTLHINVDKSEIVSIYNMTGVLYRRIEVPAGNSKFTLDRGMYIVTLKDGSVHKIVIK